MSGRTSTRFPKGELSFSFMTLPLRGNGHAMCWPLSWRMVLSGHSKIQDFGSEPRVGYGDTNLNSREWWCESLAYHWKRPNPSLKTDLWRVYNRGPRSPKGVRLVLRVDDAWVKVLKARDFKPFYNMQRAAFKTTRGRETTRLVIWIWVWGSHFCKSICNTVKQPPTDWVED
jgi:hypothetical protein